MDKERAEAMSTAAMEVIDLERKRAEIAETEQQKRERLIAESYRMLGRIETSDLFGKLAQCATFVWLKKVKDSKIYRDLPGIETWETFCNRLGKSRRSVDEQLQNLEIMGQEFLAAACQFSVGYKDLRKLRKRITDGDITIDERSAIIAGESIPLDPDHKDDLEAAIESLLEEKDRQIEDKEASLRSKNRVLEEKEKVINKQEKLIIKYEGEAQARGLKPGEGEFLQQIKNAYIRFEGFLIDFDPEYVPAAATPRMTSAYMEALGYFRRMILAAYDTAGDQYGMPEIDDGWIPPHLRPKDEGGFLAQ